MLAVVPTFTPANAKAKAKAKIDNVAAAKEAISRYQFERADSLLKVEIKSLKSKRKKTTELDQLLESIQSKRMFLQATERVIFFDSLVCSKDSVLQNLPISRDAGRLDTWARTYYTTDSLGCTLYENELANKRYFALPASEGNILLASSDKIGNEWTKPAFLVGLNEDDNQNYPYLLSDGLTLYFAAEGDESIGGYDIFVTRNNGDDGTCLTPENIGFPFNSDANDYLYIIDEMNNIGWFVTDRRQPEGYICIYAFIPNETRRVYGDEVNAAQLGSLAQLNAISDTWYDEEAIEAAQQRLQLLREGKSVTTLEHNEFYFPINAITNYTSFKHFHSAEAALLMKQWLILQKNTTTDRQLLDQLRDRYAQADEATRKQLKSTIERIETTYYPQLTELNRLAKKIRQLENAKL